MDSNSLIISKGTLQRDQLKDKIAIITGAGGGIGFEAARSLAWLGVRVVIAELNEKKGKIAEQKLNREFGEGSSVFIHTDVGNEKSIRRLVKRVKQLYDTVDIIINNATITPMGAVHKVGIKKWDLSYQTNLRGPVLLISYFLPEMIKNNSGIILLVPSSGAAPFMGAYEVFKTAQVELANTLAAELEGTGIITYSIGPGIVKTETAQKAIEEIAPLYGKTVDEFYQMSENALLTVEEAGAGFAASIAFASNYQGLEIGSIQALMDCGISIERRQEDYEKILVTLSDEEITKLIDLFKNIKNTFIEQVSDWKNRPLFERQWVNRDFKKHTGNTAEFFIEKLKDFEKIVLNGEISVHTLKTLPLDKLFSYYLHQIELLKGYEKNPEKVKEYSEIMNGWLVNIEDIKEFINQIINQTLEVKSKK